ncbi:hypothetical protein ACFL6S_27985 [Candidatus Poribacteria bacterium]
MSLQRIQQDNIYIVATFPGTATTVARNMDQVIPDLKWGSETVLTGRASDDSIAEYRMPNELELQQARLMNIPTRGFCVSADLEKINADSYRYSYDPEEFAPPDID